MKTSTGRSYQSLAGSGAGRRGAKSADELAAQVVDEVEALMSVALVVDEDAERRRERLRELAWANVLAPVSDATNLSERLLDWMIRPLDAARAFSPSLAIEILRKGIEPSALAPLGELLGMGRGAIAQVLGLHRTTPARQGAKGHALPVYAAEGVLRLLEIEEMAHDTFETPDEATSWLKTAHPMLDGETPLQAAGTSYGAEQVKSILVALKYGGVV